MNAIDMHKRIVRYGELIPCKTAFIDAHTPGSDQKENFSIIGAGVSESADQHVHIFFVLSGRWRFFWGNTGDAGEVVLEEGDLINLPTDMFRGFENIGSDYGKTLTSMDWCSVITVCCMTQSAVRVCHRIFLRCQCSRRNNWLNFNSPLRPR